MRLPVGAEHLGCVIVPAIGAGGPGGLEIITFDDAVEVQPDEFVTVKLYVPGVRPETV
jgi:hypothetical protein